MAGSDLIPSPELQAAYNREAAGVGTFSGKISDLCKFVWAGSLAFFYGTMSAGKDTTAFAFYQLNNTYIYAAAICGSIALIADYLQYLAAHRHSTILVEWIRTTKNITRDQFSAHTMSIYQRMNSVFFVVKNVFCIAAAALIGFSIVAFVAH